MAKFSEDTLASWVRPPSETEESKLENAERMVRDAIRNDPNLSARALDIFGQGSYANDTNVRLNSDIDINVCYTGGFYYQLPAGANAETFGLGTPSTYSHAALKNDVETALVNHFGRNEVVRKDKCITIKGNTYRVQTDVVPTWRFRRYSVDKSFDEGVKFCTDKGVWIDSFPKQHILNGRQKNAQTSRRFKRLTRLYRKLRYHMIENGQAVSPAISSFLLECLVWNVPDNIFNDYATWTERLKQSILWLHTNTQADVPSNGWGEVSYKLYLLHANRKWTRADINTYLAQLWHYLEF